MIHAIALFFAFILFRWVRGYYTLDHMAHVPELKTNHTKAYLGIRAWMELVSAHPWAIVAQYFTGQCWALKAARPNEFTALAFKLDSQSWGASSQGVIFFVIQRKLSFDFKKKTKTLTWTKSHGIKYLGLVIAYKIPRKRKFSLAGEKITFFIIF